MHLPMFPGRLSWQHRTFDLASAQEVRWYAEQTINAIKGVILATKDEVMAQIAEARDATDNVANDVTGLKTKLDDILANQQSKIDAEVASQLQEISDGLAPVVTRLQAVAAETPDETPDESTPTSPVQPQSPFDS